MLYNKEKIKDIRILFDEIAKKNRIVSNQTLASIYNIYHQIKIFYKNKVEYMNKEILKEKIYLLKKKIQKEPYNNQYYIELISFMIKANIYINKYEPRDIQIISVLFFLYKDKNSGLIEEILTGEGKTIIISFLAIIKVFQGKKVDILTSSLVLAERDAKEMKPFYNFFYISIDYCKKIPNNNNQNFLNEENNKKEYLDCYKADIVYGDPLSFESDILRTNFMNIPGRGKYRNFDCIIIDEIDNICIDNIKNITELLDNFHGYKFLEYIYLFIYNEIKKLDQQIWANTYNDKFKHDICVFTTKSQIIEALLKKAKNEFSDLKLLSNIKHIYLPEHLKKFIKCRLKKWCESAYDAFYIYKENKEYIITQDERYGFKTIKPVDFSNTGVIKENSVWTGLHQFLQIKEGLYLTEENLNSCYMSNFTFFKKYISNNENNIYGLTGTLGSFKTQEAMKILYQLNLLFIPTFKESKLNIYPPIIINDKYKYKEKLINEIINVAFLQNRAVLVIFKYIKNVNKMYNLLIQRGINAQNIIKYTRNDIFNESEFLNYELKTNLIILSTNLSGRGTDIKISPELEANNGLHVILTFFPFSERIERQAFGRAGRKGEKGSGQLIINSQDSYEVLVNNRKKDEENEFNYLIKVYKKRIDLFQELFEEFTEFLNKIRKKNFDESILLDIKERWGIFLVENDLAKIEQKYKDESSLIINEKLLEETRSKFKVFMLSLKKNVNNNKYEYFNPLLLCKTFEVDRCDEAIEKSPIFCIGAYLFRTLYIIEHHNSNYKYEAKKDFKSLENNCKILLNQIYIYLKMMKEIGVKENSDLYKQTQQKINFFNYLLNLIRKNNNAILNLNNIYEHNKNVELVPRVHNLKQINYKGDYYDETMNYFKDYGMCLYSLDYGEKSELSSNCHIF